MVFELRQRGILRVPPTRSLSPMIVVNDYYVENRMTNPRSCSSKLASLLRNVRRATS